MQKNVINKIHDNFIDMINKPVEFTLVTRS